jgi:hypothetical protein
MSFYMSFDENDNDRRQIEGGSYSIGGPGGNFDTGDIKASLDSIRSEHAADSKHIPSEAKGTRGADLKDAAKVRLA